MSNIQTRVANEDASGTHIVSESWGQPSAGQYRFELVGSRMFGYLVERREKIARDIHQDAKLADLRKELSEWDSLSDEALLDFEDMLE